MLMIILNTKSLLSKLEKAMMFKLESSIIFSIHLRLWSLSPRMTYLHKKILEPMDYQMNTFPVIISAFQLLLNFFEIISWEVLCWLRRYHKRQGEDWLSSKTKEYEWIYFSYLMFIVWFFGRFSDYCYFQNGFWHDKFLINGRLKLKVFIFILVVNLN